MCEYVCVLTLKTEIETIGQVWVVVVDGVQLFGGEGEIGALIIIAAGYRIWAIDQWRRDFPLDQIRVATMDRSRSSPSSLLLQIQSR